MNARAKQIAREQIEETRGCIAAGMSTAPAWQRLGRRALDAIGFATRNDTVDACGFLISFAARQLREIAR